MQCFNLTKIFLFGIIIIFLVLFNFRVNSQGTPFLTIKSLTNTASFTKDELLKRKDIEHITLSHNPAAPGKTVNYTVIKLCHLLAPFHINPDDKLEFLGFDGYSSYVSAKVVMSCSENGLTGYLAIEPAEKWPPLPHGTGTGGPIEIVWKNVSPSDNETKISWAWSLYQIVVHPKDEQNPIPPPKTTDKQVLNGYNMFIRNCSACHSINGMGHGSVGPDLNFPKNPVEYYKNDQLLKEYIRNPQNIRRLKNDKMPGVGNSVNDKDLNDLIRFFHFMASVKDTSVK